MDEITIWKGSFHIEKESNAASKTKHISQSFISVEYANCLTSTQKRCPYYYLNNYLNVIN